MNFFKSIAPVVFASPIIAISLHSALAAADFPTKIHTLYNSEVCGDMTDGSVRCLGYNLDTTQTFETVTTIKDASDIYANSYGICIKDTTGIRCPLVRSEFPLRDLITSSEPGSVKLDTTSACGIEPGGILNCLAPDWYSLPNGTFRQKLPPLFRTISVGYDSICWGDDEIIECRTSDNSALKTFKFRADEIATTATQVCARNSSEAKCWGAKNEIILSQDFLTAKKWFSDYTYFCAITADERMICVDWQTGAADLTNQARIPPEFQLSGSGLAHAYADQSYQFCAARGGAKTATCWSTYGLPPYEIVYDSEIESLKPAGDGATCAFLKSGEFDCRSRYGERLFRLLKKSGPLIAAKGFQWNQNGVTGTAVGHLYPVTDVASASSDSNERHVCAVGVMNGVRGVHCTMDRTAIQPSPYDLRYATSVSTGIDKACAIQGGDAFCWGEEYAGVTRPSSFWNVQRLVLSYSHACAVDDFGLICWGDLALNNLEVPAALSAPGEVIDVALGYNRTCALLKNQTVECWGRKTRYDADPPKLTGVTELVGSRQQAFCAKNASGYHCWGGSNLFPK